MGDLITAIVAGTLVAFIKRPKTTVRKIKKLNQKVQNFATKRRVSRKLNKETTITPEFLFQVREYRNGFAGVYIIYNETKDLFYVGQAQDVYQRCNNHFTGKGNGDIYADYKYGDDFSIEFIPLIGSGFNNLDELETFYIERYDAIDNGYNKKKGNLHQSSWR